jgi:splicing factor 3B subunit 3
MELYNFTLNPPGGITHAVYGNFSDSKKQEIVIARNNILEMIRPDDETGKIIKVCKESVFGIVRSLKPLRSPGEKTDVLIVGSDSGKLIILRFSNVINKFYIINEETFGKTGCRRIVPGQMLAQDPRGRAIMVSALEKQKFVYILHTENESLVVSSPLEAHRGHNICFDIVGLDVGYENPLFACLEIDYEDVEEELKGDNNPDTIMSHKLLTFYELDLGLNSVIRKQAEEVEPGANLLIPVPGGNDGPGGLLVCAENWIIWQNIDQDEIRAPIPRRAGTPDEKGLLIISYTVHQSKNLFFFLLQSELGDIYKVTLDLNGDENTDITVKYFDTIPVCKAICVLKTGYLFAASEFGNHYLFTFKAIGDNDESPETSNLTPYSQHVYFTPRELTNLQIVDENLSLSPIINLKVEDLQNLDTPQIYLLCGRGVRSSLRILKYGLTTTEMAVSEITGTPTAVWSLSKNPQSDQHSFIVVSFLNATMVLSVGETVEEVNNSGFNKNTSTISAGLFGKDLLCQVYKNAVRLISGKDRTRAWEWTPPMKKEIVHCAQNGKQLCLALKNGELVYFELDRYNNLVEVTRKELGVIITALGLEPLPVDRIQCKYLAVGCEDGSVRLMSLENEEPLTEKTVIMMGENEQVSSILFKRLKDIDENFKLYLYVGTFSGNCARLIVSDYDGKLSDKRTRFLGTKPVKLFLIQIRGEPAVLALSSRSWITYTFQGRLVQIPLSYVQLEYGSFFKSKLCREGIVAISDNTLRIITIEKLDEIFNQTIYPLRYTPRQMLINPITQSLIICEADHNSYPLVEKEAIQQHIEEALRDLMVENEVKTSKLEESFVGVPKAQSGKWGSCIRIMDPSSGYVQFELELEDNEAAFRMCLCQFARTQELYLIVGTVKDLEMNPKRLTSAFIHTYQFFENYKRLMLVHKTQIHDIPLAMCAFKGQLLVGIGKTLRLYDLGRKKLLKKCENRGFPHAIMDIKVSPGTGTNSDRIYVSDMIEGIHVVTHREKEKQMFVFADTITPRYITSNVILDYDTIAYGDKFGNFTISRVQMRGYAELGTESTWNKNQFSSFLNGAPLKLIDLVHFHVGDTIMAMEKKRLMPSGDECIIYGTIHGQLGVLVPFRSKSDIEFYQMLEIYMRQHLKPLCGNEHIVYRSYYYPVKSCIDGDLCEMFATLTNKQKKDISEELAKEPAAIMRKLENLRISVL